MKQVITALLAARREIKAVVFKSGENSAQKYKYVGHEQVLTSGARDVLLKHGLVLVQKSVEYEGESLYTTRSGSNSAWRWQGTFMLAHESGEVLDNLKYSATTGPNDKAAFVASTALDRTAHMRILELAGTNEDPEHDEHEQEAVPRQFAPFRQGATIPGPGGTSTVLLAQLDSATSYEQMLSWTEKALNVFGAPANTPEWKAFGVRCKALSLDGKELVAKAKETTP